MVRVEQVTSNPPPGADQFEVMGAQEGIVYWKQERERLWEGLWVSIWTEFAAGTSRGDRRQTRKLSYAYAQALYDDGYRSSHKTGEPKQARAKWRWAGEDGRDDPKDWIRDREARWERRDVATGLGLVVAEGRSGVGDWAAWRAAEEAKLLVARYRIAVWMVTHSGSGRVTGSIAISILTRLLLAHKRASSSEMVG